jgi:hypothetical protein
MSTGKKPSLAAALTSFDTKASTGLLKEVPAPAEPMQKREPPDPKNLPPSRKGKKTIAGHFDPEVSRQFKLIGAETDRSLQDMLTEAINDFFQKYGKPPIA